MSNPAVPPGETASPAAAARIPVSPYFMALISAVFVIVGLTILVAFSGLFIGDAFTNAPLWVQRAVLYGIYGLGLLSAWQTLRQAKRKAIARQQSQSA